MIGFGVFSWIAGGLQLVVPSYALRLVRRFGTQRVGWFIVMAFAALALLHLLAPMKPANAGPSADLTLNIAYALGSVLLLIGMGHMETLFSEREQARLLEERQRKEWETQVKADTAELARTNDELIREVARREQMLKALEESEARYKFLFFENPRPMWILDLRSCRFLAVNQAALRQYGYTRDEFMALTGRGLLPESAAGSFLQDIGKPCPGPESRGIWQHRRRDGALIDVEITALDMHYTGTPARLILADDTTTRRLHERESRKAEKLEALGNVAAGVAHHFNNILTIIEGHTSALLDQPQDAESAAQLERISEAVNRAAALIRQLLAAAGRQPMQLEPLDVNALIQGLNPMLRRLVGKDVIFESKRDLHAPLALADRRLLEHTLVNLVLNARDAMANSGTLTIGTAGVRLTGGASDENGRSGQFICISVADTGCGIPPEIQERIFEPFFTTRDTGRAAGLGLASVHGDVTQQAGWIEFSTQPGAGTEFRIYLPSAPEAATRAHAEAQVKQAQNHGTILLVEPDDRLRALVRCVLDWNGYRVIEADSSATALVLWDSQAANVDLLLTNTTLPEGMLGCDLAAQLRRARPSLKVIYSADAEANAVREAGDEGDYVVVSKPFKPASLLDAVQESLEGA